MDEVSNSLSFIEGLLEAYEDVKAASRRIPKSKYKEDLEQAIEAFSQYIAILDSETTPIQFVDSAKLTHLPKRSIVDRLGIGGELVRLRMEGHSVSELNKLFKISEQAIRRFFKYYDTLNPSKKAKYARRSIFNLMQEVEDLSVHIKREINRLTGTNDEIAQRYVSEMRQLLSLASSVLEKASIHSDYQQFRTAVFEVLLTELPDRRAEILNRIKDLKSSSVLKLPYD